MGISIPRSKFVENLAQKKLVLTLVLALLVTRWNAAIVSRPVRLAGARPCFRITPSVAIVAVVWAARHVAILAEPVSATMTSPASSVANSIAFREDLRSCKT